MADDLSDEILENLDWLHFGYPTTMKSLYENDGEELLKLLEKAEKHGVKVSLDTSLPDLKAEAGQVDWRRILPQNITPCGDFSSKRRRIHVPIS